jgi:hypothetical protein
MLKESVRSPKQFLQSTRKESMMTVHTKTMDFQAAIDRIADISQFATNGDFDLNSLSREPEKLLTKPDGGLFFNGSLVRSKMPASFPVAAEFTKAVVEPQLPCCARESGHDFLLDHWNSNAQVRKMLQKVASECCCVLNEMGTSYYTQEELLNMVAWMTKIPKRYEAIHNRLTGLYGGKHEVNFEYLDGTSELIEVPAHPALAISLAQDSLNVGFCPERIGLYFDFFQGPAQLISALFSNSAILGRRLGRRYNNRIFQWRHAMSRTGELTPFSLGSYTDISGPQVLGKHLKFVHDHAKEILTIERAGKVDGRPWPILRLLSGSLWLISVRLQWRHNDDGKIVLWLEVRSLDAQPTLGMSLAVELAMIGYALYWIRKVGIRSVTEVMSHDRAYQCFENILVHGPESMLPLEGSPTGIKWFQKVSAMAIEGLIADGVCSGEFAESAMDLLNTSLQQGTTGSSWMRSAVQKCMNNGRTEQEAILSSIVQLGKIKRVQDTKYGNFKAQGLPAV